MSGSTFVKICGITRLADARNAVRSGANAVGFVFAPSPRRITPGAAARIAEHVHPSVRKFGVFVDAPLLKVAETVAQVGLDAVQLQGSESPSYIQQLRTLLHDVWVSKVVRVTSPSDLEGLPDYSADMVFVDSKDVAHPEHPSRRIPVEWLSALRVHRLVVAGGLDPENVADVVRTVHPWGVDVSGGVEVAPGKKDPEKVTEFVKAVRHAEA